MLWNWITVAEYWPQSHREQIFQSKKWENLRGSRVRFEGNIIFVRWERLNGTINFILWKRICRTWPRSTKKPPVKWKWQLPLAFVDSSAEKFRGKQPLLLICFLGACCACSNSIIQLSYSPKRYRWDHNWQPLILLTDSEVLKGKRRCFLPAQNLCL